MRADGVRNRPDDPGEPTAAAVWAKLRDRAERIKQRELDEAVSRIDAHGELTPAQRDVLVEMATQITETIVGPPDAVERATASPEFDVEGLVRLFDLDDEELHDCTE